MDDKKTSTISFTLNKNFAPKKLNTSKYNEEEKIEDDKEIITGLEGNVIEGSKSSDRNKGPAVIPMVKRNRWVIPNEKVIANLINQDKSNLDAEAAQEILQEINSQVEVNDAEEEHIVPLLMQNCAPRVKGIESSEKLDIAMRPETSSLEDYENMPISNFGQAMLRGMGWSVGQGIGKTNKQVIKPIEFTPRYKGLGLGAERLVESDDKNKNKPDKIRKPGEKYEEPERTSDGFARGVHVMVVAGPHADLYGKVEGIDGDNGRIFVALAINKEKTTISQNCLKIVSEKEYTKNCMRLNKVDKVQSFINSRSGREETLSSTDSLKSSKRKRGDEERYPSEDKNRSHHGNNYTGSKDHYHSNKHDETGSNVWVRPKTRVRLISKSYKHGRYYNHKVKIIDVIRAGTCICETDDGRLLENITEDMLETIVPKGNPAYVIVVKGKHAGMVGKIVSRDKSNYKAVAYLLSNQKAAEFDYDDICEYTGDIDHEDY
ncbi:G patch domain and KOW motifs-containing protein [Trichoplax sp. H2]|nr:G patch domain and KOW motifs-containing protein [Trichoplax sp. H2]|eukprot:RDD45930.1 G patch domain and KOW motifs-containing protein [Trichoplax sp. H2]